MATRLEEDLQAKLEQLETRIPVYYLRYEDLVLNPEPVLRELFCFMFGVASIEGTVLEKRLADYVARGSTSATVYKLKADPRQNLSRNAHCFTDAQLEAFKEKTRGCLYYYNYSDHPEGLADASTTFFKYDGPTPHDTAKLAQLFGGYKRNNARALEQVCLMTSESPEFKFNESHPVDFGLRTHRAIGTTSVTFQFKE